MMKNIKYLQFIALLLVLLVACSEIQRNQETSQINLKMEFQDQIHINNNELSKIASIQTVTVTVSGSDMETVSTELSFDIDAGTASGSIEVPQGEEREFLVEGHDQNGLLQFSGSATEDLWDDEVDLPVSVYWITPDPITLGITDYSASGVTLSWSASTASDFGFYLPLISTSPNLTLDDWWRDTTITGTMLTIDGLDGNTVYYVAIVVVDTENWFQGGSLLEYSNQNTIIRSFTTPVLSWLYYDDSTFEEYTYSTTQNSRVINYFDPPSYPCYIQSVWLNLNDDSGVADNYKLIIMDENDADLFVSVPLPTESGINDVIWNVQWSSRAAGTINSNGFVAGIEYTKTNGWPEIGLDKSSDAGEAYYIDAAGDWFYITGNLGINAIVQLGGSVDSPGLEKRMIDLEPTLENQQSQILKHQFEALNSSDSWGKSILANSYTEDLHTSR